MNKVSMMNCKLTIKSIMKSEMGILLLEANENSMYDVLANRTSYEDRLVMNSVSSMITYHLFPLMYSNQIDISSDLINSRANAVHNIFKRWTSCGYNKRHAKNHFNCKEFDEYIDDIQFLKADYMLLLVD